LGSTLSSIKSPEFGGSLPVMCVSAENVAINFTLLISTLFLLTAVWIKEETKAEGRIVAASGKGCDVNTE